MPITDKDKSDLRVIFAELSPRYGGKPEDYFPTLILTRRFKVSPFEVIHQTRLGSTDDLGINAYFVDREARNLYLIAAFWTDNHNALRGPMEQVAADLEKLFAGNISTESPEFWRFLIQDIREVREVIERIYVQVVFKGDIAFAERSEGLGSRREAIEAKQHVIEGYLGRSIEMRVDVISDRRGKGDVVPPQSFDLAISDVIEVAYADHRMMVGFVSLYDLFRIYDVLKYRFFDRNIRASLSPDLPPNKRLREAFATIGSSDGDAGVFVFRHNGVTLAAERVTRDKGTLKLHVPRLLNGAQTVSSFAYFLAERAGDNAKIDHEQLEGIRVLAKIIESDPAGEFVVDVTIATNQQNPVPPWALRAMDTRQVDLADKFREELGIFYSRQEGVFDHLSDDELDELGVSEQRDIKIKSLAQTFLAVQGEIDRMSRLPDVFQNATYYDATFRPQYTNQSVDVRDIILAYKIGLVLRGATRSLAERMPVKYQLAIKRGKNLVWALLVQALFNDRRIDQDRAQFGTTLSRERAFRERVEGLVSSRVSHILKEVLSDPVYEDRLSREKYEFLRTKELYKRCLQVGVQRWKWTKKGL